jgi:glucokinase
MLLAGDIGGTKTRLALYRRERDQVVAVETQTVASRDSATFVDVLLDFIAGRKIPLEAACFGAPGPVMNRRVSATNLPWEIDEGELASFLGIEKVRLVNDLVATAAAIPRLKPESFILLHPGTRNTDREQRCVVLAPGTGLGQAFLILGPDKDRFYPSEGGHADFAPTSDIEIELLRFLMARFQRVSYERVLSGPGLENIYDFLCAEVYHSEPADLKLRLETGDRAKVISESGLAGQHEVTTRAMDLFAKILGSQAGNLGLAFRASGGVYLGGGIPPKIIEKLTEGATVRAFLDKEPMTEVVEAIPLRVIMDDHAALHGAAAIATRALHGE